MADAEDPSEKYDQDFFLALAAKGKDAWNAWRRDPANKDKRVTFAGVDFSQAPRDRIDFSGFEFGDNADFSGCKWRGVEQAIEAFTPGRAFFTHAGFGTGSSFAGAAFGDCASFASVAFGNWSTTFVGVTFGIKADFRDVVFGDRAIFAGAAFGHWANFNGASFGDEASFAGAAFGHWAQFKSAACGDRAIFAGAAFDDETDFTRALFRGRAEFSGLPYEKWFVAFVPRAALGHPHRGSKPLYGSGPDRFLTISFLHARFYGEAIFSGRTLEGAADFTEARFYYPPDFDAVTNAARIDFTGANIGFVPPGRLLHWTSDTKVPLRLRTFRKIAEDTKNHDLERDLYIEERKAERGVYLRQRWEELKKAPWIERPLITWRLIGNVCWTVVMFFYWALSNYGRSFLLPAAGLALSVWLFHWGYAWILAPLMPQTSTLDAAKYARAEWMLALGNAVPFVGPRTIDAEIKKFLFCPGFGKCLPLPPEGCQWLVLGQNLFSITCVFFIGLALRNYFKIK